ncbi:HNH endonuclease [Streptomyces sp. SP18CM02]|uniref:HNH endonuclease n=1 Tax=Streptomyces sp. SP18CM02 TaxID=2758571 RepID=UPI00168A94D0|nr:HNH endonuclease signature motif containing protein [Streptomyces sp. SP18CM02]MBD3552434.1 HNH endonuclease [Streptomyces sp. SP18CM02]
MTEVESATPRVGARAWSFLVAGDERQFQGNAGYEDIIEESYSYDSTVGNHQHVAVGDLVVVRNGREALGAAYVEALQVLPDQKKVRSRCRFCRSTGFKGRRTMLPRFWCSACKNAFDDPVEETVPVTAFRAHYGGTWQPLDGCLDKAQLRVLSLSRSDQQSIKKLDRLRTLEAIGARGVRLPHPHEGRCAGSHRPQTLPGGSRRATAAVRRGQDAFRRALVRQYGLVCAVTGAAPAEVLEAAHLRPFAETQHHRVEEGLMLRSDVHRLFDSGLLAIDADLVVHVAPSLAGHGLYCELAGVPLQIAHDAPIDRAVVADHHAATVATW